MRFNRTTIAAAFLLTATAAFAHGYGYGPGGYGPGGCMGQGYGAGQPGYGPMCDGTGPNGDRAKMRAEMIELRRLAAQGAAPEAYAEQQKKVDEARREMWAARGEGGNCPRGFAAPPAAK